MMTIAVDLDVKQQNKQTKMLTCAISAKNFMSWPICYILLRLFIISVFFNLLSRFIL